MYYALSRCHCGLFYKDKIFKKGFSEKVCYHLMDLVFSCQMYHLVVLVVLGI